MVAAFVSGDLNTLCDEITYKLIALLQTFEDKGNNKHTESLRELIGILIRNPPLAFKWAVLLGLISETAVIKRDNTRDKTEKIVRDNTGDIIRNNTGECTDEVKKGSAEFTVTDITDAFKRGAPTQSVVVPNGGNGKKVMTITSNDKGGIGIRITTSRKSGDSTGINNSTTDSINNSTTDNNGINNSVNNSTIDESTTDNLIPKWNLKSEVGFKDVTLEQAVINYSNNLRDLRDIFKQRSVRYEQKGIKRDTKR